LPRNFLDVGGFGWESLKTINEMPRKAFWKKWDEDRAKSK
jgi:hypothetical protein